VITIRHSPTTGVIIVPTAFSLLVSHRHLGEIGGDGVGQFHNHGGLLYLMGQGLTPRPINRKDAQPSQYSCAVTHQNR
jgi:hypothetical protein